MMLTTPLTDNYERRPMNRSSSFKLNADDDDEAFFNGMSV